MGQNSTAMKKIVKVLAVVAGISVAVCVVSVMLYLHKGKGSVTELLDLGQTYLEDGNYEQAVASLETMLAIDPKKTKTEEERAIVEKKNAIVDELVEIYIAWADEERAKGNEERAKEIRQMGYEKTGDERLNFVLADDDVYNYVGRWDELVRDYGLEESEYKNKYEYEYESEDGSLDVSWQKNGQKQFFVSVYENSVVSILGIKVGDKKDEVEEKLRRIEVAYNATYINVLFSEGTGEFYLVLEDDMQNYYEILIGSYVNGIISYEILMNDMVENDFSTEVALLKAQEKYGKIPIASWGKQYYQYIRQYKFVGGTQYEAKDYLYSLSYINDDEIPELYLYGNSVEQGNKMATSDGNKIDSIDFSNYMNESLYIERGNLIDNFVYPKVYRGYHHIYSIENGKFKEIASGGYDADDSDDARYNEDDGLDHDYTYYWNGDEVSEKQYEESLHKTFDEGKATNIADLLQYNYEEIIGQIVKMNTIRNHKILE